MEKFKVKFLIFTVLFAFVSVISIYLLYKAQLNSLQEHLHEEYKQVYIENKKYHIKDIVNNVIKDIMKERIVAKNKFRAKLRYMIDVAIFTLKKANAKSYSEIESILKELESYDYNLVNHVFFVLKDGKFLMKPYVKMSDEEFKRVIEHPQSNRNYLIIKKKYKGYVIGVFGDFNDVDRGVKDFILATLAGFRYESDYSGYIIVLEILKDKEKGIKTILLLNPNKPDAVGQIIPLDFTDAYGKKFNKEIVEKCLKYGEGYVSYHFKIPNTDKIGEKITYFKLYKDWNWIIGTGFYLDIFRHQLAEKDRSLKKLIINYNVKFFFFIVLSFGFLVLIFMVFISKNIKELNRYVKKIEENEKFKEILLNLIPNPIFVVDKNGDFIDINKSFETFFGVSKEKLLNKTCKKMSLLKMLQELIKEDLVNTGKMGRTHQEKEKFCLEIKEINKIIEVNKSYLYLNDEFIGMIGVIIDITDQQKLTKKLYDQSIKDELTGAYNRRYLTVVFEEEKEKLYRKEEDHVSAIMFDLDFFKKINDTYGHGVGDKVLKTVTSIVKNNIRKSDYLFRIGGEEFLILLPGSKKEVAFHIAEKIRKKVAAYDFEEGFSITISLGVTELKVDDTLDDLLTRVDAALYMSKKSGRNRTTLF